MTSTVSGDWLLCAREVNKDARHPEHASGLAPSHRMLGRDRPSPGATGTHRGMRKSVSGPEARQNDRTRSPGCTNTQSAARCAIQMTRCRRGVRSWTTWLGQRLPSTLLFFPQIICKSALKPTSRRLPTEQIWIPQIPLHKNRVCRTLTHDAVLRLDIVLAIVRGRMLDNHYTCHNKTATPKTNTILFTTTPPFPLLLWELVPREQAEAALFLDPRPHRTLSSCVGGEPSSSPAPWSVVSSGQPRSNKRRLLSGDRLP